ncbi:TfoX/Sxy family protein [Palleronia sp. KMU-117]|uniref:TfoX/Sxy family protein n=1 Tax=Palleronia sp. KMU-117 TaxID=3434108 RepID=UPI003D73315C
MAYDEGLAALLREDLVDKHGIAERRMFGGLAFLLHGHMVCGVHPGGAMFRVGKPNEAAARAVDGAGPMMFSGRAMGGMIDVTDAAMADDARRRNWLAMALSHARSLPPK